MASLGDIALAAAADQRRRQAPVLRGPHATHRFRCPAHRGGHHRRRKLLIFGNGGSAADAQHIAAEFVNRFCIERRPLAAIALTTDTSIITSIGNDYHFDQIFAKQLRALGAADDVAIGISTSGNSPNVLAAVTAAREMGLYTIGLTGRGGRLAETAELVYPVASDITARIQETHITLMHVLCDLVDRILFAAPGGEAPCP